MFVIEDERHAESIGEFEERAAALAELHRLAAVPWDARPNVAPCTNWRACGRNYELVEFEIDGTHWRELRRVSVLEVSKGGVKWAEGFQS